MQIVIYNPASIDSVIAAACLMTSIFEMDKVAYPAGNKVPMENCHYHWVGVEPIKTHTKQFPGKHSGYFAGATENKWLQKFFDTALLPQRPETQAVFDFEDEIIDELKPSILKTLILDYRHQTPGLESIWLFARLVQDFEWGVKDIDVDDQALLWDNYNNALQYLTMGGQFSLVTYQKDLVRKEQVKVEYLNFMNNMKHLISMMFETTSIAIDGAYHRCPLINVNQSASPWLLRLISNTYDYGVTYEQRRGQSIYTTFSRIAGFDHVIMKGLAQGGEKNRAYLSSQL